MQKYYKFLLFMKKNFNEYDFYEIYKNFINDTKNLRNEEIINYVNKKIDSLTKFPVLISFVLSTIIFLVLFLHDYKNIPKDYFFIYLTLFFVFYSILFFGGIIIFFTNEKRKELIFYHYLKKFINNEL